MKYNFSNSRIKELNIIEEGNYIKQQANIIKNTDFVNDNTLQKLIEKLEEISENSKMKKSEREKLVTTINEAKKSDKVKRWRKIREFLSSSANLASIVSLGFKISEFFNNISA